MQTGLIKTIIVTLSVINTAGFVSGQGSASMSRSASSSVSITATLITNDPVKVITLRNLRLTGFYDHCEKGHFVLRPSETYISPVTDERAGLVLAKGRPGAKAILHYKTSEILRDKSGKGLISIRYELSSYPNLMQRYSRISRNGEIILNFDRNGNYYIWVGGYVNLKNGQQGSYIGHFTFEIVYV